MSNNNNFFKSLGKALFSNFGLKILAFVCAVAVFVVIHAVA